MKTCSACGHNNSDLAQHCAHCQSSLVPGSGAEKTRLVDISEYKVEVGDVIDGRYKVVRLLGRGGMGEVYLVLDLLMDGEECALKLIHHALMRSPEARQRFRSEVSISRRLHYPAIVKVYDIGHWQDQSEYYFTMEYLEGTTLAALLADRQGRVPPFTLAEIRRIILPLLQCLSYAHTQTIHRDIKPDNIMVQGEGPDIEIKILDFGIARAMSASRFTQTAQGLGTPYYMAPEQMEDAHHIDHRADLYGVGAILYELLTGKRAMGLFKLPSALAGAGYSPFDTVVATALAPEPEDRPADAGAMLSLVEQALNQTESNLAEPSENPGQEPEPESVSEPSPTQQSEKSSPTRPDKKFPFFLPLPVLGVAVLLIIGITFFVFQNKENPSGNDGEEVVKPPQVEHPRPDPVAEQLARCDTYLKDHAWKEAESCYAALLRKNPDEQQAISGLNSVHEQVVNAGLQAVQKGETQKARNYLTLLQSFSGADKKIKQLNKALAAYEDKQKEEKRQKEISGQLTRCAQLLTRDQYRQAHSCYTDVLQRDQGNKAALSGLNRIEEAVCKDGMNAVASKDLERAREQGDLLDSLGLSAKCLPALQAQIADLERQQAEEKKRQEQEQERANKIAALRDQMSEARAKEAWSDLEQLGNKLLTLAPKDKEGKKMLALARERLRDEEEQNKQSSVTIETEPKDEQFDDIRVMDKYDRQQLNHVYERGVSNRPSSWVNPDTGNQFKVTPQPAYESDTGRVCRKAKIDCIVNGKHETVSATACRDGHGHWQLTQKTYAYGQNQMQEEADKNMARLTIDPDPKDAKIRILNIKPRYEPGMELKPGRYHIEVSTPGYKTKTEWVELVSGEKKIKYMLEKNTPLIHSQKNAQKDESRKFTIALFPGVRFDFDSGEPNLHIDILKEYIEKYSENIKIVYSYYSLGSNFNYKLIPTNLFDRENIWIKESFFGKLKINEKFLYSLSSSFGIDFVILYNISVTDGPDEITIYLYCVNSKKLSTFFGSTEHYSFDEGRPTLEHLTAKMFHEMLSNCK